MYDRSFFQTKLGHASLASISAMVLFVALATQMQAAPAFALADSDAADRPISVEMA
ncbi:hypothetical protein [Altererythrobacter sp. GH1-8]|uniref:hypothetical protein n=1 Tax=Altererythrobacter sp. GH1-8 TaxID=3349333 RepID=UPI00374D90C7